MMIHGRLFKTIPSLLPRNFRSFDDYIEESKLEMEESWEEKDSESEEEIYWI